MVLYVPLISKDPQVAMLISFNWCFHQPTKLARAALRTRLEHSASVLTFLGRAVIHRTIAKIALAEVKKPKAYFAIVRAFFTGNVWSADIGRMIVYHHLAFKFGFAVWAWNWLTFGRVV